MAPLLLLLLLLIFLHIAFSCNPPSLPPSCNQTHTEGAQVLRQGNKPTQPPTFAKRISLSLSLHISLLSSSSLLFFVITFLLISSHLSQLTTPSKLLLTTKKPTKQKQQTLLTHSIPFRCILPPSSCMQSTQLNTLHSSQAHKKQHHYTHHQPINSSSHPTHVPTHQPRTHSLNSRPSSPPSPSARLQSGGTKQEKHKIPPTLQPIATHAN